VKIGLAASGTALGALVATAAATAGGPPVGHAAACTPKQNLEAIIDDSGSMSVTDPDRLRVQGMNLFIRTPGNERKTLGAVAFGSDASTVFAPQLVAGHESAMVSALRAQINADDGLTSYNAAFGRARSDNAAAEARIFLTDGGSSDGADDNGHRGGPPTYVVGFGTVASGEDATRLKQIASETGGKAFLQTDSSNLQAVFNSISTLVNCQSPPTTFRDAFTRVGQSKKHSLVLGRRTRSVQFTLSWANADDRFDVTGLRILRNGRLVRTSRVRRLRIRRRRGETFVIVKVTRVTRGRLRFRLKAKRLENPGTKARLTTQAGQSRRR
jgi:von Willebrand factor type A domain